MTLAEFLPLAIRGRTGPVRRLKDAAALRRQRIALSELTPERLADIGLTPDEARAEAARPLWDVPQHWLR